MSRYVIEGRDTEVQPRQVDFIAAGYDPDTAHDMWVDPEAAVYDASDERTWA